MQNQAGKQKDIDRFLFQQKRMSKGGWRSLLRSADFQHPSRARFRLSFGLLMYVHLFEIFFFSCALRSATRLFFIFIFFSRIRSNQKKRGLLFCLLLMNKFYPLFQG